MEIDPRWFFAHVLQKTKEANLFYPSKQPLLKNIVYGSS